LKQRGKEQIEKKKSTVRRDKVGWKRTNVVVRKSSPEWENIRTGGRPGEWKKNHHRVGKQSSGDHQLRKKGPAPRVTGEKKPPQHGMVVGGKKKRPPYFRGRPSFCEGGGSRPQRREGDCWGGYLKEGGRLASAPIPRRRREFLRKRELRYLPGRKKARFNLLPKNNHMKKKGEKQRTWGDLLWGGRKRGGEVNGHRGPKLYQGGEKERKIILEGMIKGGRNIVN